MSHDDAQLSVHRILGAARCILLDFDGPVCSVFAGAPAHLIATNMRDRLVQIGAELTVEAWETTDPMVVLRFAGEVSERFGRAAEALLAAAEREAVQKASPTPGGEDFIRACATAQLPLAIVSNNTGGAIEDYLAAHGLRELVAAVSSRDASDARLMKPHPRPIRRALDALGRDAAGAVLIGDATSDVAAARAAGICVIGYANKPTKLTRLAAADAVVTDMRHLTDALQVVARSPSNPDARSSGPASVG